MKIGLCDDDKNLRLALKKVIEPEGQLMGIDLELFEYDSGEAMLRAFPKEQPDILFLDIEMGGINGMEAAKELRKASRDTVIIFVTSHRDFVFQGYEVRALHYILKPYKEEKIKEVFRLALHELGLQEDQYYLVEQKAGTIRLPLKEIQYFQSDRKKITAVSAKERVEFYGKLSDLEREMPEYFIRIHNRYLANLNFVSKVESTGCICAGAPLPVSRSCKQELSVAFARMMLK